VGAAIALVGEVSSMMRTQIRRPAVACLVAACMALDPTVMLLARAGQAQPAAKPATTAPAAPKPGQAAAAPAGAKPAAAAAPKPIDGGWPRVQTLPGGATTLIYQPQIASWEKQAHVVAYSAVS